VRRRATGLLCRAGNSRGQIAGYYTLAARVCLWQQRRRSPSGFPLPVRPCRATRASGDRSSDRGRKLGSALLWDAVERSLRSKSPSSRSWSMPKDEQAEAFYLTTGLCLSVARRAACSAAHETERQDVSRSAGLRGRASRATVSRQ